MSTMRIGCASGFLGDRLSAMREMVLEGLDVIMGDYLAELTMLILARQKAKDPSAGYATTFLTQVTECLGALAASETRVVVNAGGMNPLALADAIRTAASGAGLGLAVAAVDGDDLTASAEALGLGAPLAANAYLGGEGIRTALERDAQIVVTGRVTDAALVTGPAAWFHGWAPDDHDRIAGAMAAGHVIECGMQATGGNFSFFTEISDLVRPGFPIAEIAADGSAVITKSPGSGGAVTAETVLSQLLYEVAGARYPGPDATLRLDALTLTDLGRDRVLLSGARGEAPPPDLKVSVTEIAGYRQELVFDLTGLDVEAKAALIEAQFAKGLSIAGLPRPETMEWTLARTDHPDARTQEEATARLRLVARDPDPGIVGRNFANIAVEFGLGSVPGFFMDGPPGPARPYGRFRPGTVAQSVPAHTVHLPDGTTVTVDPPAETTDLSPTNLDSVSEAGNVTGESGGSSGAPPETASITLGRLVGARSGDKGAHANIGVWARTDATWLWLRTELTADRLRRLLPETEGLRIDRVELPRLRALNFVVHDLLGEGVASGARFDPQAKGLAEWLRSRTIEAPSTLSAGTGLDDYFRPTEERR